MITNLRKSYTVLCGGRCEGKIYEGESYYIIEDKPMCKECASVCMEELFEGLSFEERLNLFGFEKLVNENPWED